MNTYEMLKQVSKRETPVLQDHEIEQLIRDSANIELINLLDRHRESDVEVIRVGYSDFMIDIEPLPHWFEIGCTDAKKSFVNEDDEYVTEYSHHEVVLIYCFSYSGVVHPNYKDRVDEYKDPYKEND